MRLFLLIALTLSLTCCQAVRDRLDLWFVVPRNPFLTQPVAHEPL